MDLQSNAQPVSHEIQEKPTRLYNQILNLKTTNIQWMPEEPNPEIRNHQYSMNAWKIKSRNPKQPIFDECQKPNP